MSLIQRCSGRVGMGLVLTAMLLVNTARAVDYGSMSISDVIAVADRALQKADYDSAIPALEEVLNRTKGLTDPQGKLTAQKCRMELARAYYQKADISSGMPYIEDYLNNEPRNDEATAMRMLAQGFFEVKDWDKIIDLSKRLMSFKGLSKDDLFSINLLVGQAYFQKGDYDRCIEPLRYAEANTRDEHIQGICEIMMARALVESKNWEQLYPLILRIDRTDLKYDITLNLTLMKAGEALFNAGDYLNALYVYRMVLPRSKLLDFANKRLNELTPKITAGALPVAQLTQLRSEASSLTNAVDTLKKLPPFEEEVSFRIGQIYAQVKRYWEGFVVFDKIYRDNGDSKDQNVRNIAEAALLQSVLTLYEVDQVPRAENRVLQYLDKKPGGDYARTLLSTLMRHRLASKEFSKIVELRKYLDRLPSSHDLQQVRSQADLNYMMAFGYLQTGDYASACDQFEIVQNLCQGKGMAAGMDDASALDPDKSLSASALYYHGMGLMLQASYTNALSDFETYQKEFKNGAQYPDAVYRQGVCLFGLQDVAGSEKVFKHFTETFPSNSLVSEAYSMLGDIEASKQASVDDPLTLDRAQADYRKAIDLATTPMQASYPAFQAAKTYKMEFKWQDIIDLMNYYMERWEKMADVAEAVYWKGQAQIELGQLQQEAIPSYIDAIMRYGNDPQRVGVDKIITELVKIAEQKLSPDDKDALAVRLRLKLANVDESHPVLRMRLQFAQAMLEGHDSAVALASKLLGTVKDLSVTTPLSLSMMCDVAVDTGNTDEMKRLSNYFTDTFPDSDLLWHGYKASVFYYLDEKDYKGALETIDQAQNGPFDLKNMGWAQITKANTLYKLGKYKEAETEYNRLLGVPQWRGPLAAQATLGIGKARLASGDLEGAHVFFQRTYLMYKAYDHGKWAADGYLAAADCLVKEGRKADALKTLQAMLDDNYTKNYAPDEVRKLLKKYEE